MAFSVHGQRVVVIGAVRSGLAAAALLRDRGAHVTVADQREIDSPEVAALARSGVTFEFGAHREGLGQSADLVVVSPGVPLTAAVVAEARSHGVPVIGEVELASRWITGRIVAITGTKGKSTTTTLITRMLRAAGIAAVAGGNLGTALSAQVADATSSTVHVVEVSSFQLETTDTFHPWISVLVNVSPDHLDRHASFEEYTTAKARVFARQTPKDWAVINADDPTSLALAQAGQARRFDFGFELGGRDGATVKGDHVVVQRAGRVEPLVPLTAIGLPGRHMLANVMAATAVASVAGASADAMTRGVDGFAGLEHALERVGALGGVRFINDSKATNVVSVRRAIESFDCGVVPIMGGRYKGGEFGELRDVVASRASGVVVIGEAADRIASALEGVAPVRRAGSMTEAVHAAFDMARPNGVVVLAPGCSSFDMFSDYMARGRAFKDAVHALAMEVAPKGA